MPHRYERASQFSGQKQSLGSAGHRGHLLESASFPERPSVSFSELAAVDSIASLFALYKSKGKILEDPEGAIAAAKADWARLRDEEFAKASEAPLPASYPVTKLSLDGCRITLIGIVHSMFAHVDAFVLYRSEVVKHPILLTEQNLGMRNYSLFSRGLDVPDHHAKGFLRLWADDMADFLRIPFARLRRSRLNFGHKEKPTPARTLRGQMLSTLLREAGVKRNPLIEHASNALLHLPGSIFEELPTALDLSLRHDRGIPYTRSQARAAYMAEFIRHWHPEWMKELDLSEVPPEERERILHEKAFLCGKGHEEEIKFFLLNGCRDQAIVRRARRDVDILHSGLQDHIAHFERLEFRRRMAVILPPPAAVLVLGKLLF